jgi:hypothetical protein
MPYAVDEEKLDSKKRYDVSAPPNSPSGLPMKQIPHMEFPRVVYMHPKEPWRKIEHRNAQHEIVEVETVPAEHRTRLVTDKNELSNALKEGWVKEPYVPQPPPDPNANLYDAK